MNCPSSFMCNFYCTVSPLPRLTKRLLFAPAPLPPPQPAEAAATAGSLPCSCGARIKSSLSICSAPKRLGCLKSAGEVAGGQMLGTRKGSCPVPEKGAYLYIWVAFPRGTRVKSQWVSEENPCEVGEINHPQLWSRCLGRAVLLQGALGKQEHRLSASVAGTSRLSKTPLSEVAADVLCVFAFLCQSHS